MANAAMAALAKKSVIELSARPTSALYLHYTVDTYAKKKATITRGLFLQYPTRPGLEILTHHHSAGTN